MSAESVCFEQTIAASANYTSGYVKLVDGKNVHALEYVLTGDGTMSIEVYTSISGKDYISNGVKASGLTKTSGPGSDGKGNVPLSLNPGDFLKVKLTETGGANAIVPSIWFVQK